MLYPAHTHLCAHASRCITVDRWAVRLAMAATLVLTGSALVGCSDPAASQGGTGLRLARRMVGDTMEVSNSGTSGPGMELSLREDLRIRGEVVPEIGGFTTVTFVYPTADGGVVFNDRGVGRLIRFDSSGAFQGFIGTQGQGPEEYTVIAGVSVDSLGQTYVISTYGDGHLFGVDGEHVRRWKRVSRRGSTVLRSVDARGRLGIMALVPIPGHPDSMAYSRTPATVRAIIQVAANGQVADTSYYPGRVGDWPRLQYRPPGYPSDISLPTLPIPLVPYDVLEFSTLGYWVGGEASRYELKLFKPEGVLRITSDYAPVEASPAERRSLLDHRVYSLLARGTEVSTELSQIPEIKPAFKAIRFDADGRIWVQLHAPGHPVPVDTTQTRANVMRGFVRMVDGKEELQPGAPVHPSRPSVPTEEWVEPVVYDVFAPTGDFGNASGEHIWLIERDVDDVPSVVRYRVKRAPRTWSRIE